MTAGLLNLGFTSQYVLIGNLDIKELRYKTVDFATRHPWELARLEVVYSLINDILTDKKSQPLNILDLGCGDLFVSHGLSKKIPSGTFYAVDSAFTEEKIEELSRFVSNHKIFIFDSVDKIRLQDNIKFDLVLILDVLEHIDDIHLMENVRNNPFIDDQTIFVVTVPAYQVLFCSRDHFLGHKRRYTNTSLKRSLNEAGFKVLKMNYFFFILLIPRMIRVLLEKITKPNFENDGGIGKWKGKKRNTSLFKRLLILDFKTTRLLYKMKIKIPGLSNYAICQKHV